MRTFMLSAMLLCLTAGCSKTKDVDNSTSLCYTLNLLRFQRVKFELKENSVKVQIVLTETTAISRANKH